MFYKWLNLLCYIISSICELDPTGWFAASARALGNAFERGMPCVIPASLAAALEDPAVGLADLLAEGHADGNRLPDRAFLHELLCASAIL